VDASQLTVERKKEEKSKECRGERRYGQSRVMEERRGRGHLYHMIQENIKKKEKAKKKQPHTTGRMGAIDIAFN